MLEREYLEQKKLIEESKRLIVEMDENDKMISELIGDGIEELSSKEVVSSDELKETLSDIETYSNKIEINNINVYITMLEQELDKLSEGSTFIRLKMEQQINMLKNLFSLDRISKYKALGKMDKKSLNSVKQIARHKLDVNKKYTFIEPNHVEKSLKEVLGDKKKVDIVLWRLYNFIATKRVETEGTYIYFLMLTLATLNNEDMKEREIVIKNLEKLF